MKANILVYVLMCLIILLGACAPAAGRSVIKYKATATELIDAIAEFSVTQRPSDAFNFYSVNTINEKFISLKAATTGGVSFWFGASAVVLNFTALEKDGVTSLAANAEGAGQEVLDPFIFQLDNIFERAENQF
jgi:hypothetical protein